MPNADDPQDAVQHRSRFSSRWILIVTIGLVCSLMLVVGSSWFSDVKPVDVTGTVRVNGRPLKSGVVSFRATDNNRGSYAAGLIGEGGRYTAESPHVGPGILPGKYLVGILAQEDLSKYTPQEYAALVGLGKPGIPSIVPEPFTDPATSGLTVTIVAPGPQTYDVNIECKLDGPTKPNEPAK